MIFTPSARRLLALLGIVGLLVAVALLAAPGPAYEMRGEASVPYNAGTVKQVRVLDSVTVYVDGEPKPGAQVIAALGLLALASAAFVTALALSFAGAARRLRTFYLLVAAGLGFAAVDELFAIHESVGHNLRFLADIPGVTRPDDVVLSLYLVPIAVFAYLFRDIVLRHRAASSLMGAGVVFFAMSSAADIASLHVEEYLELIAGLCVWLGVAVLMYRHLRRNLQIRVEARVMPQASEAEAPAASSATPRVPAGIARY
jgi:hypothetical protein